MDPSTLLSLLYVCGDERATRTELFRGRFAWRKTVMNLTVQALLTVAAVARPEVIRFVIEGPFAPKSGLPIEGNRGGRLAPSHLHLDCAHRSDFLMRLLCISPPNLLWRASMGGAGVGRASLEQRRRTRAASGHDG